MSIRVLVDHRTGGAAAVRHPEKAHRPDNPIQRKPAWIRVKAPSHPVYPETRAGADGTRVNFFLVPITKGKKVLIELVESNE